MLRGIILRGWSLPAQARDRVARTSLPSAPMMFAMRSSSLCRLRAPDPGRHSKRDPDVSRASHHSCNPPSVHAYPSGGRSCGARRWCWNLWSLTEVIEVWTGVASNSGSAEARTAGMILLGACKPRRMGVHPTQLDAQGPQMHALFSHLRARWFQPAFVRSTIMLRLHLARAPITWKIKLATGNGSIFPIKPTLRLSNCMMMSNYSGEATWLARDAQTKPVGAAY